MKALIATEYGTPEVLRVAELPVPTPGEGEILVRVAAAGLNPADLRLLSGVMRDAAPLRFPHVLGSDFAGSVVGVGPGAGRFRVGDEVFGFGLARSAEAMAQVVSTPPPLTTGAMAEYAVVVDTPAVARRPVGLAVEHAATLGMVGLTALPLLRAGAFQRGETVLVIGATGGVGGPVVPLLATAGAHVIATASPPDEDYVRSLGASEVVDHRAGDTVAEVLRRYPGGVDTLVNLALPGPALVDASRVVRERGNVLNVAFPSPDLADFPRRDLRVATVFTAAGPGDLDELAARAVAGKLPSTVSRRYEMERAADAFADLERDHVRGKFVVVM
jgi:NADPH:quinone reductase-like Zn-dependent oxidoreductase